MFALAAPREKTASPRGVRASAQGALGSPGSAIGGGALLNADDRALAALTAQAGDERAFSELVRRHQGVVRGLLTRLCRDASRADDIAQDTFVKAHAKIGQYRGGSFKSWLCAVAYREFLMAKRKDRALARLADAYEGEAETDVTHARQADAGATIDLDRALARLRPEEREVVTLCFAADMSHAEAAEALGKPLGSVKSLAKRGRDKLRAMLAGPEEKDA